MFEIARMDYTQYRKHFFPKQQDGWDILSCCFASPLPPQRCPARLFIDDNCRPRSAAVVMGDFVFLSGEPKLSFLKEVAGRDGLLLIARNEGWQEQLPALAGESFADYKCYPRYRFSLAAKEDQLQQILSSLPEQHYQVDIVYDGADGLDYALSGQYDIVILDVMLPKKDGFEVVHELREHKISTPVLMLTARDDISDKVQGLDCGADDYMTKPFSPEELLARIRALSRRQGDVLLEDIHWADLTLKLSSRTLHCGAKSVSLGFKEFEVLKILLANPNGIVSKEELIVKVWGSDSNAEDNNVEAYISFLRKKFYYLGSRAGIGTVRKVGYHLEENA